MQSRPIRKSLKKVSVGPYIPTARGRKVTRVNDPNPCITQGALYDVKMGILDRPGWPACEGDYAACFGGMGVATLKTDMLNPLADNMMLQFLSLFVPEGSGGNRYLKIKPEVEHLVLKHKTFSGFRRLKAISEDITVNQWKIWPEGGGVKFKTKAKKKKGDKEEYINFYGRELKELLEGVTQRHTVQPGNEEVRLTLEDIGWKTEYAKPEDWVIGGIPIIPNIMRAPQYGSSLERGCAKGTMHPFTQKYSDIVSTIGLNKVEDIRSAYLNLIKDGDSDTLVSSVFSSNKNAFIRGGMFSKTGGNIIRSVIAPNPNLRPDQIGIPRRLALDASYRVEVTDENLDEIRDLIKEGHITHIFNLKVGEYIRISDRAEVPLIPRQTLVLRELQNGDYCVSNRAPSLHKFSILGFKIYLHDEDCIYLHPSASKSFGADSL